MKLNYFNFKRLKNKILLTNDFGRYTFVDPEEFKLLVSKKVDMRSEFGKRLTASQMIFDETNLEYSAYHRYDLRELKNHVNTSTSLHIFVVTTACNMNCVYCQASNGVTCSNLFMDRETARKSVDIALQSPTYYLSFEFQGGEPLLNFDIIKYIVEYAEEHNVNHQISYNVVTNLTLLTDEMIEYFKEHCFGVSTSIDGSEVIHNQNRTFKDGRGTFSVVLKSIKKLRECGVHVGAIETTTKASLDYPKEIAHAYADLGFDSIFVRPLTPLGKANAYWKNIGYTPEEFVSFYREVLKEIIEINKKGRILREEHAAILLGRIGGQFVNYMELRSPCGAGIGQLAYYADGNIFTCDEGRMFYEMGDNTFCLGNVYDNSFNEIINNRVCKTVCASSILETIPTCCDCVYQPYCGTCPVVNYALNQDVIEKQPRGYRCVIYSGILDYLFEQFLKNDSDINCILESWSN